MFRSLLVLLSLTFPAFADVTIVGGDKPYEPHSLVKLKASGVPAKAGIRWKISPKIPKANIADTDSEQFQFAAAPGKYTVELLAVSVAADGKVVLDEVEKVITIGGTPVNPPDINPKPPDVNPKPPDPKPINKADKVWVIIVEESSVRTPEFANSLNDAVFWEGITSAGHKFRILDKDQPEVKTHGFDKHLSGKELPTVLLMDDKGNVLKVAKWSGNAGLKAAIQEVTK